MAKLRKHKLSKDINRQEKKKRFSKEIIITIIIASVMILSVFGIMFSSYNAQELKEEYKGYEFNKVGDSWVTLINDEKVYFSYSPSQLEGLEASSNVFDALQSPVIVVTFNPNSEQIEQIEGARLKLAQDFTLNFNKAIIYGITEENKAYNMTKYTCANSTIRLPVIELRAVDEKIIPEGNETGVEETGTKIYLEGDCVVIAARERDWLPASERLLYGMFGIIE